MTGRYVIRTVSARGLAHIMPRGSPSAAPRGLQTPGGLTVCAAIGCGQGFQHNNPPKGGGGVGALPLAEKLLPQYMKEAGCGYPSTPLSTPSPTHQFMATVDYVQAGLIRASHRLWGFSADSTYHIGKWHASAPRNDISKLILAHQGDTVANISRLRVGKILALPVPLLAQASWAAQASLLAPEQRV
jgi:hypothetical protein